METKRSLVDERTPPPSLTPRHSEQQKLLHMVMDGHFLLSGQTDEPDPTIDRLSHLPYYNSDSYLYHHHHHPPHARPAIPSAAHTNNLSPALSLPPYTIVQTPPRYKQYLCM